MKKIFTLAAVAMMSLSAMATDLFTEGKQVSWGNGGVQIAATQFASAKAGDKIVVTYTSATDGIEFKMMPSFNRLPGSRSWAPIDGNGTFEQFLTPEALDSIQAGGLEIIGANFNCTKVELLDGKESLKEGITVWTGYFWADEWSTLELCGTGYKNVDWDNVTAIRFYSEANRTDYVLNFMKGWGEGEKFADQNDMTMTNEYAEWTLTADRKNAIKAADNWMVQFNKEGGNAFNVTDIVLVLGSTTGMQNVESFKAVKTIENGQIVIIKNGVKFNAVGAKL